MRTDSSHHLDRHRRHQRDPRDRVPTAPMYWGWSHANRQMEMMDLAGFLDAYRIGYQQATDDLQARWQALTNPVVGGPPPPMWGRGPVAGPRHGPGHHDDHHRRMHHGWSRHGEGCEHCEHCDADDCHDCRGGDDGHRCGDRGCRDDRDCGCECCISRDADVVVYSRCGELRRIPIEIDNDTRRARDDVTVEVSDVRSAGGRSLPWVVELDRQGPLTLDACSTTTIELVVGVICEETQKPQPAPDESERPRASSKKPPAATAMTTQGAVGRVTGDVDRCEVGYVTVRVEGCLLRPIVVAIAAVPKHCGAARASCSCSCCC